MYMLIAVKDVKEESYGGKADQLIRLQKAGVAVPESYVISYQPLLKVMIQRGLLTERGIPVDYHKIENFFDYDFDSNLFKELYKEIQNMLDSNLHIKRYAVRSSHDYEDGSELSFSGLFHTELNLKGPSQIVMAIIECWKKSFQKELEYYYKSLCVEGWKPCSILIQEFIASEISGVAFRTGENIIVNANYGLAKAIVDGNTGCDSWIIDNRSKTILEEQHNKSHTVIPINGKVNPKLGEFVNYRNLKNLYVDKFNNSEQVISVKLAECDADIPCMSYELIQKLICFCSVISKKLRIFYYDIEWAYDGNRFVALQCRPLTSRNFVNEGLKKEETGLALVKGEAVGALFCVSDEKSARRFPKGGILAIKRLEGSAILAATKASGCITESKSPLSHSAIIARELGIPAVGAINISTLKEGQLYYINGESGEVREIDELHKYKYGESNDNNVQINQNPKIINKLISESAAVNGDFRLRLKIDGEE